MSNYIYPFSQHIGKPFSYKYYYKIRENTRHLKTNSTYKTMLILPSLNSATSLLTIYIIVLTHWLRVELLIGMWCRCIEADNCCRFWVAHQGFVRAVGCFLIMLPLPACTTVVTETCEFSTEVRTLLQDA